MPHVLFQWARFVDGKMPSTWVVSIDAVEAFLQAVTEKSVVLSDVRAFCAVLCRHVSGLPTDVAADIFCRLAALVHRVGQDMAPATLFEQDKSGGEVHGQSAPKHISGFTNDPSQFPVGIGEDHSEGAFLF